MPTVVKITFVIKELHVHLVQNLAKVTIAVIIITIVNALQTKNTRTMPVAEQIKLVTVWRDTALQWGTMGCLRQRMARMTYQRIWNCVRLF